jgi:hypothetical protein
MASRSQSFFLFGPRQTGKSTWNADTKGRRRLVDAGGPSEATAQGRGR